MNEWLSKLIGELREGKWALATKQKSLEAEIWELQKQLVNSLYVTETNLLNRSSATVSNHESEELENQTNPVETSGHSESGETSDLSSSLGIHLNVHGKDLTSTARKPE